MANRTIKKNEVENRMYRLTKMAGRGYVIQVQQKGRYQVFETIGDMSEKEAREIYNDLILGMAEQEGRAFWS